ncbi:tyrosine-type recombinase/integrase [Pseudomaricurvus albidus]|uniref:tyrosine-type recombinase/integrase n=1 Tax=Pseudomaricurvus albidus TaxID=2842452 RepID=UPI001C0B39BB|nr:tyrosine-type recombinase/integrase [Aestuariicella albida]
MPFLASVWPLDEQGEPKPSVGASEARRALKRLLKTAEAFATDQGLANPEQITHGSLHSIRHRRAQNLLAAGEHLRTVQSILRHRQIETTAIYTEPEDDQRRQAMENDLAGF